MITKHIVQIAKYQLQKLIADLGTASPNKNAMVIKYQGKKMLMSKKKIKRFKEKRLKDSKKHT